LTSYKLVANISELKPNGIQIDLDGDKILIAKLNNEIVAVSDICTHAGCFLSDGNIKENKVECPCHAGEFNLITGEALGGPVSKPVKIYDVKIDNENIFIKSN